MNGSDNYGDPFPAPTTDSNAAVAGTGECQVWDKPARFSSPVVPELRHRVHSCHPLQDGRLHCRESNVWELGVSWQNLTYPYRRNNVNLEVRFDDTQSFIAINLDCKISLTSLSRIRLIALSGFMQVTDKQARNLG